MAELIRYILAAGLVVLAGWLATDDDSPLIVLRGERMKGE